MPTDQPSSTLFKPASSQLLTIYKYVISTFYILLCFTKVYSTCIRAQKIGNTSICNKIVYN